MLVHRQRFVACSPLVAGFPQIQQSGAVIPDAVIPSIPFRA